MNLPYVRALEYISPSSLRQFENNPVEFYLQRLGPVEAKPKADPQGWPAAVGCAFDSEIKPMVAEAMGLTCRPVDVLLQESLTHKERDKAMAEGRRLALAYVMCGALRAFAEDKPTQVDWLEMAASVEVDGIPIRGKPDAVLDGYICSEFKVSGSGRPGISPMQGYARCWDTKKSGTRAHAKNGAPLEELNEDWATQLVMYSWILGFKVRGAQEVAVDQICVGKDGRVRVAQYRTVVSAAFRTSVKKRLALCWKAVETETVVPEALARGGLTWAQASR